MSLFLSAFLNETKEEKGNLDFLIRVSVSCLSSPCVYLSAYLPLFLGFFPSTTRLLSAVRVLTFFLCIYFLGGSQSYILLPFDQNINFILITIVSFVLFNFLGNSSVYLQS